MLAHEVLAALWAQFGAMLCKPSEKVAENLRASCKANSLNDKKATVLPLGIHGDGVPNQAHNTVVCFAWTILHETNSERLLFASLGNGVAGDELRLLAHNTTIPNEHKRGFSAFAIAQSRFLGS